MSNNCLQNPILPGFHPDPSICRVGEDYYLATSTFEWFPGVMIYHSKDLINWELVARPLDQKVQLDMQGVPDSCGVWAPCLSHADGKFYLVYTNVKSFDGIWKDTPNYVVTSENIEGPWSPPSYLKSSGFDGSFFHEGEKTWFLNMLVDHRGNKFFGGIQLQEYDRLSRQLTGPIHYLTSGSALGKTEGPHLYKKDGYYYLILAEGGTEYGHAETVFRSRELAGPYESNPSNPFLSCAKDPSYLIQKTGHASMVQGPAGKWYIFYLMGRPLETLGRCTLGRETGFEEILWENGWPRLAAEDNKPRLCIPMPEAEQREAQRELVLLDRFDKGSLPPHYQSLRIPFEPSWMSLSDRKGYLRLYGKESLSSTHRQALIGRRIQHFHCEVTTSVEFSPDSFQQMAGLSIYYNTGHFHYAHLTNIGGKKLLRVISSDNFSFSEQQEEVELPMEGKIWIKARIQREELSFFWALEKGAFHKIGATLDMSIISDDYVRDGSSRYRPAFTGSFACLCCQDLEFNQKHADFEWMEYKGSDELL